MVETVEFYVDYRFGYCQKCYNGHLWESGRGVSVSVPLVYYLVGGWDTQQFKLAANQRSAFN